VDSQNPSDLQGSSFSSPGSISALSRDASVRKRNREAISKLNHSVLTHSLTAKTVNIDQEGLWLQIRKENGLMETSSFQQEEPPRSLDQYVDTDQGFASAEENRRLSTRIPYSNPEEIHDAWFGGGPERKLAQYPETLPDESPSPLLPRDSKQIDIDDETPYKSHQELKKTMNKRKRVIKKGGLTNVTYKNISKKKRRYISDLYTTLLDSPWRYLVLIFAASFYLSWMLFAVVYYFICLFHGDFDPEINTVQGYMPCIKEIDGFAASFLFSLETQHTIGYGTRQTTTACPDAIIVMSMQSVLGCLIQAFMVGLVFSKLSRPSSRSKTVIFSQNAVVNVRNKKLCLIFRIGDLRDDNFILGTQISAKILRRRITHEGELFQEMQMLNIDPTTSNEPCIFFVWPLEIIHVIDEESPLYDMSAVDIAKEKFEIVVIMEGTIETSSMTFQARTSYLPNEILWGHRFEPMTLYRKDHNKFQVNFSAFHSTYEVQTPLCSARELETYHNREIVKQQRTKHSMQQIARGFPATPSTLVEYTQTQDTQPFYSQSEYNHLSPEHIPRSSSVSSRPRPRSPRLSMQQPSNQTAHTSISSNLPRDDSETSTDSSLEKALKKKKRTKMDTE